MRKRAFLFVPIMAALFSFVLIAGIMSITPETVNAQMAAGEIVNQSPDKGCLGCHDGIEQFTDIEGMADLGCVDCHMGNEQGTTPAEAHTGMYANPTDLRVIGETCGTCHEEYVSNVGKSLHATSAGVISGTRYTWNAQADKNAIYGNYAVSDEDGDLNAKNAKKELAELPYYDPSKPQSSENHPADDYLRNQCLRCHVWSTGHQRAGDYRASGCAACHVEYDNDGLYKGGDKMKPYLNAKNEKGGLIKPRARVHKLERFMDTWQCQHCHNRGARTGVSYTGMMESDGYGSPWDDEKAGKKAGQKLHGKNYNHLQADAHFDAGMDCIDCHNTREMHGDGNIYSKKWMAIEVQCTDCHGDYNEYTSLTYAKNGEKITNLKKDGDKVVLTTKRTKKELVVPQTKDHVDNGTISGKVAMNLEAHQDKIECYTCNSGWAPQCYGCHAQQDISKPNGDWLTAKDGAADPSQAALKGNRDKTAHSWKETRSYVRWEDPVIGINQDGMVAPFVPGCQAIFTQVGGENADGTEYDSHVFTTSDGHSGLAQNPIVPHTTTGKARTCESCHASKKALGLGGGVYDSRKNGLDIDFELERIVDEEGNQIQATSHYGARPFNKEEQQKIYRVNACLSCHSYQSADKEAWDKVAKNIGEAPNDKLHSIAIETIMKKAGFEAENKVMMKDLEEGPTK